MSIELTCRKRSLGTSSTSRNRFHDFLDSSLYKNHIIWVSLSKVKTDESLYVNKNEDTGYFDVSF